MLRRDLLAGALLAAGSACSRRASSLDKLRVGVSRRLSASSFHLALERGYFREAGFAIEILQAAGPLNAIALLSGGQCDVHFGSLNTALLNAIVKGLPIRIVAGREIARRSTKLNGINATGLPEAAPGRMKVRTGS